MKLHRLLALIAILAVPFWGMAQTEIHFAESDTANNQDSIVGGVNAEYEIESNVQEIQDSINHIDEYIYVTEYEEEKYVVDKVITRLLKTRVDSNYITTNDFGLMIKPIVNMFDSQSTFRWDAESDTMPNRCTISSHHTTEIGIWFGYRTFGYCLSFSLDPIFKDKSKRNTKFGFSWYGDAWGAEINMNKTRGDNLTFNHVDTDISNSEFTISRWQINTYYAPRYRKFSYNAAFSHSMRQEKSAGSPLLGISMNALKLYVKPGELSKLVENQVVEFPSKIRYFGLNLNVGYAHNFVTKKKTLFHISALPDVTLLKKTEVKLQDSHTKLEEPRFLWGVVGRASWIWQKENHLISLFGTLTYNNIIRFPVKVSDTVYNVGLCYGFRAYKHHRPRKERKILKRKNNKTN